MTLPPSLHALEFERVLALIALEAKSEPGKQTIAARRPLPTVAECELAQARLAEMVRFYHQDGLLPLSGLADVEPLFLLERVLDLSESWQVVRAARATQAVRETFVRGEAYPRLRELGGSVPDLSEVLSKTNKYFTRDGKLREEASSELKAIRQRVNAKRNAIQRTLNDVMNRNAAAIQEPLIVMRGDRYCIPVRADHRSAVSGILHERSGSGASFFIEPLQVVELNNDLADLLIQEREEIARITTYISQLLVDDAAEIKAAVSAAAEFDALQASALFFDAVEATRPSFSDEAKLSILDGRHPLLDERLAAARREALGDEPSGSKIVPLTISLSRETPAFVISGPNAGGKTVALKTAGLLVALGMSGLPVPAADGTVLPVVDSIHVLIGDDQSVLEHLSTFSGYLVRLKRVLEKATKRSLILLDELGSGTDPEEGAALAAAVIEYILERGALLIATTHLSALKGFAVKDSRIVNASMEFDQASGHPTYRMITGIPGRSRAIDTAQMIGLPSSVLKNARERLGDRFVETDQLLAELQRKMSEIVAKTDELREQLSHAERERATLSEKTAAVEKERARLGGSYREELERLRDDVARQLTVELKSLREMDRSERERVRPAEVVASVAKPIEKAMEYIPADQREVRVGDRAEHRKFKVTGEVVSVDGSKAVLNVNGRKMTVDTRDLIPAQGSRFEVRGSKSRKGNLEPRTSDLEPQVSAELNLIGQRVDDALEESDKFLDRALLEGKQAVRIIHGFGTGALRKALREHLRKHPAVKSWRPGEDNEGGDGATIAILDS